MRRVLLAVGAVLVLSASQEPARAAAEYPRHEAWVGLGGGASLEHDIFNVPEDVSAGTEAIFSVGYFHNLDAHMGIGFQIYGASQSTPTVVLVDATGLARQATFDLTSVNFGLRGRYLFSGETLKPYVAGGLNLVTGSASGRTFGDFTVDALTLGDLGLTGVSVCVGGGLAASFRHRVRVSAEAVGSFGAAKWRNKPFANSTGVDFNPSIVGGIVNVGYLWGW